MSRCVVTFQYHPLQTSRCIWNSSGHAYSAGGTRYDGLVDIHSHNPNGCVVVIIITSNWIISTVYLEGPTQISNVHAIDWELDLLGICIGNLSVSVTATLTLSNFRWVSLSLRKV